MGLWRPLLVASANSRSGRLDGCGQLPTHSAQPPALGACRWGGTPRGGDTGVPPHSLAGRRRRQRLSPGSARGTFSCSSGGWFLAAAPLLRLPPRAPGPEVQGAPLRHPCSPHAPQVRSGPEDSDGKYLLQRQTAPRPGPGAGSSVPGGGKAGLLPRGGHADGSPGGQASGPRPRSPRRTHSGPAQHVGREDAVPCPSRSRPPREGPGHTGLGSSSHFPLPSAGAGTWVPTQGWTRSHGHVEPSPRADRV